MWDQPGKALMRDKDLLQICLSHFKGFQGDKGPLMLTNTVIQTNLLILEKLRKILQKSQRLLFPGSSDGLTVVLHMTLLT